MNQNHLSQNIAKIFVVVCLCTQWLLSSDFCGELWRFKGTTPQPTETNGAYQNIDLGNDLLHICIKP